MKQQFALLTVKKINAAFVCDPTLTPSMPDAFGSSLDIKPRTMQKPL